MVLSRLPIENGYYADLFITKSLTLGIWGGFHWDRGRWILQNCLPEALGVDFHWDKGRCILQNCSSEALGVEFHWDKEYANILQLRNIHLEALNDLILNTWI